MQLGQKVYEASQQAQQNAGAGAGAQYQGGESAAQGGNTQSGDDDTMDASFEEVK